jgi:hypothetical protein
MAGYRDPNRNCRAPFARPDETRDLYPAETGDISRDGYTVHARRPRVPDYPMFVSPDRARNIEEVFREYDGMMDFDDSY